MDHIYHRVSSRFQKPTKIIKINKTFEEWDTELRTIQLLRRDCMARDTRKASGFGSGIDTAANLRGYNFKTFGLDSNTKKLQVKLNKFSQEWNVREEEE